VRPAGSRNPTHFMVNGRPLHDASGATSAERWFSTTLPRPRTEEASQSQNSMRSKAHRRCGARFNNMLTVIAGTAEILLPIFHDKPDLQAVRS